MYIKKWELYICDVQKQFLTHMKNLSLCNEECYHNRWSIKCGNAPDSCFVICTNSWKQNQTVFTRKKNQIVSFLLIPSHICATFIWFIWVWRHEKLMWTVPHSVSHSPQSWCPLLLRVCQIQPVPHNPPTRLLGLENNSGNWVTSPWWWFRTVPGSQLLCAA